MSVKDMFYPEDKEFSKAEERAYAREELVYNVTEDLLIALEVMGLNKKELACRLGKSRSYVTQMLSGARNMTLGSLSDICFAIDLKPKVTLAAEILEMDEGVCWESESVEAKKDELIQSAENIIDCRDHPVWVTEEAA